MQCAKVFMAWHSWSKRNDTRSPPRADAEAVLKKTRTIGAAEHGAVVATPTAGTLHHLPETSDDVLALSRLGPNMYQGTLRSGKIWRGDPELVMSLPQGLARLATLQTRERVAEANAKANVKAKAEEEPPRYQEETAESSDSRRGGGEHGEAGASDHGSRSGSLTHEAEHVLNAAGVVDLRTLWLLRRQKEADMPDHLQEAISRLGGLYNL